MRRAPCEQAKASHKESASSAMWRPELSGSTPAFRAGPCGVIPESSGSTPAFRAGPCGVQPGLSGCTSAFRAEPRPASPQAPLPQPAAPKHTHLPLYGGTAALCLRPARAFGIDCGLPCEVWRSESLVHRRLRRQHRTALVISQFLLASFGASVGI